MMNKKCDGTSRMAADRVAAEGWLKTSNKRWHLLNNDLKGRCLQDACALLETLPQLSRNRQKIIIHEKELLPTISDLMLILLYTST